MINKVLNRDKKSVSILFNLSLLVIALVGIVLIVDTVFEYSNIDTRGITLSLNTILMLFLRFLYNSGVIWFIVCIVVSILIKNVTNITYSNLVEMNRQTILSPYILTLNDVKARLIKGFRLYAENPDLGVFIKIYRDGDSVLIERIADSKKVVRLTGKTIFDKISALQTEEGYAIYDEIAYEKMLDRGYGISNE